MPDIAAALKRSPYFKHLPPGMLSRFAGICQLRQVPMGDMVFLENSPAEFFYLIVSGRVQIYKLSDEGKEVILYLLDGGEMFAAVPVFTGSGRYPANAICIEDSRLIAVDGQAFLQLVERDADLARGMLAVFAKRLQIMNGLIEDLSLRSVDARLAKYLLSVSNATNQASIRIQKKTLAAILGTIPETLSRAFKKLSAEGLIRVSGSAVEILDRKALEKAARL